MNLSRRGFLQSTTAAGLGVTPWLLRRAAAAAAAGPDGRTLVVLQLSGGNDGLNTVVPFEADEYQRARPTLALRKDQVLPLEGAEVRCGLHPSMTGLLDLWNAGRVAVVQGVGYPNPSRSHFRSMDIWHTARPESEDTESGWLGRVVARDEPRTSALHVGGEVPPLALAGEKHVTSLQNLDFLDFLASGAGRRMRAVLEAVNREPRSGRAEGARGLATSTLEQLARVVEVRKRPIPVEYPPSRIAERLRWVGQLVSADDPTRIFYLSQGGYDTHAQQKDAHALLLRELSEGLAAFFAHLDTCGAAERVAVVVFSEFGRRVRENGSLGTDHGRAAPAFVISGSVRGGLVGEHPSLRDLDEGDLVHAIDFRQIYTSVLEDVLSVPSEPILGARFDKLPLFA